MKTIAILMVLGSCLLPASPTRADDESGIAGKYAEMRSCDVYTGPCFANGEMGLTGEEAIIAWAVDQGSWEGVTLDGLNVIAVVRANATLGDTAHDPYPAKAVLIFDRRADDRQRWALARFAQHMGGRLLENVLAVHTTTIDIEMNMATCSKSGCATILADELVELRTRCLCGKDDICGNEELFYPPLTPVNDAKPAFTTVGRFAGPGLGVTFDEAGRRSAYLATFRQRK